MSVSHLTRLHCAVGGGGAAWLGAALSARLCRRHASVLAGGYRACASTPIPQRPSASLPLPPLPPPPPPVSTWHMSNTESHHSRPPIRRGYPIHLARGVPAFMDPLQYILKDAVAAPRSSPPLSPSSPPASAAASAAVAIDSLAAHTLSSVAAPALRGGSWAQAARIGRVVHESASAGTGGRTIEIDVTPAQLHELLRMRQQSSLKTATTASRDFGSTEQRASRGDYGVGLAMLVAAGLLGSAVLLPPDDASARRQALQPPFTCVL